MGEGHGGRERRRGTRHLACFPIHERAEGATKPRTAMIRELSVTGAQILTQTKREVGTSLSLSLYLKDDAPARDVEARVVRAQRRPEGGVWPWLTIVEFRTPLTDIEADIKKIAESQERMFGAAARRA